jgi:PAS domain-containing protein
MPDLWCLCRPMAERSSLPMAVVEAATFIVRYANPAFCRLISKKSEELIGILSPKWFRKESLPGAAGPGLPDGRGRNLHEAGT